MGLTITPDAEGPGKGSTRPLFAYGPRPMSVWSGKIAFDSSYPTGGEALDLTSAGQDAFREVLGVVLEGKSGYQFEYDYTNKKVKALTVLQRYTATVDPASLAADTTANTDVTVTGVATSDDIIAVIPPITLDGGILVQNATVSSANTVRIRLHNATTGAIDVASASWAFVVAPQTPKPVEVKDTTDLSAITDVRVFAWGYK